MASNITKKFLFILVIFSNIFPVLDRIGAQSEAINCTVNYGLSRQELIGFGGAIAYDTPKLMAHSQRDFVTDMLFKQLGIDIIRLRNTYKWDNATMKATLDLFKIAKEKNPDVKSFIVAWSPDSSVKSNGSIKAGTLKQTRSGKFLYKEYADWWKKSLLHISKQGIKIDFMSIQNEPDVQTNYDSCKMLPVEDGITAGYDKALEAVYKAITKNRPLFLGPETMGYNSSINYIDALSDKSMLYGYSHHLYTDGDYDTPKGFEYWMNYYKKHIKGSKPIFQTEYAKPGLPDYDAAIKMAWHIHNVMGIEEANSYLAWSLFRRDTVGGFITLDSDSTYIVRDLYHTMKHFSLYTDPGWKRVDASCGNEDIRITSFKDPAEKKLTIIITNVSVVDHDINLAVNGFSAAASSVFQTTAAEKWKSLGAFSNIVKVPAQSNTTIVLSN